MDGWMDSRDNRSQYEPATFPLGCSSCFALPCRLAPMSLFIQSKICFTWLLSNSSFFCPTKYRVQFHLGPDINIRVEFHCLLICIDCRHNVVIYQATLSYLITLWCFLFLKGTVACNSYPCSYLTCSLLRQLSHLLGNQVVNSFVQIVRFYQK